LSSPKSTHRRSRCVAPRQRLCTRAQPRSNQRHPALYISLTHTKLSDQLFGVINQIWRHASLWEFGTDRSIDAIEV
jgi:hypothetical protein